MSAVRALRILYVAYPMLPVAQDSCGGAEQMLWALEAEMSRRGHATTVAACEGSRIAGKLFVTGVAPSELDRYEAREAEHAAAILKLFSAQTSKSGSSGAPHCCGAPLDLVHDKGASFWRRAAEVESPMLATLHLPRSFYPAGAFDKAPPNLFFNCVSESQLRTFAGVPQVMGAIPNGIRLEYFPPPDAQRDNYALWIGRICPEKGTHLAIEAARRAGVPLIIAGEVYPFSYHRAYFEREVHPSVDGEHVRYVGALAFADKLDLLRRARALLAPVLAEETSSLVAMEAMACGTPVIALRRGALQEVVREGIGGFVVDSLEEMVTTLGRVGEYDRQAARGYVEEHFSARRMAADYEALYERVMNISLRAWAPAGAMISAEATYRPGEAPGPTK